MSSLATEFPKMQKQVREVLQIYRDLPDGVGAFAAVLIEKVLERADRAAASGDVVAMLESFDEMEAVE